MNRIGTRERRTLLIGAVLVGTVASGRGILRLTRWSRNARESAGVTSGQLEAVRAAVANAPMVRDSFQVRARRFVDLAPRLVDGASPAAATAALSALLSVAVRQAATVDLGAVQLEVDTTRGFFARVRARGELTGDVTGVMKFLAALEAGPPPLVVRELGLDQPGPAAPEGEPEALSVRFVVEGLALFSARKGEAR